MNKEYVCSVCSMPPCYLKTKSSINPSHCAYGFNIANWQEVDYTSVSYLQSINQPFGTLREETQEALNSYNSGVEYYSSYGIWEPRNRLYAMYNSSVYRLSKDYKEPSKGIEKLSETGILEFNSRQASEKINELIEAVNKLMEER